MKKVLCLLLAALLLCGCTAQGGTQATEPVAEKGTATEADIAQLEVAYAGREVYYGNLHDHSASGDPENDPYKTADGKVRIEMWPVVLASKELDFVALVDHRQSRHMRLDCWDETMFIGATETSIHRDGNFQQEFAIDYNILMTDVDKFEEVLKTFPFSFKDGYFRSPHSLSDTQLEEMLQMVRTGGGTLVHVHPCFEGYMESGNPLDYYLGEYTGLEVLESFGNINMSDPRNLEAREIWVSLLNMGKHVYAFAGADSHDSCSTVSASAVYAEERLNTSYMSHIMNGDFTAGPVGIRMTIGDTPMGGETSFEGQRLVIGVGDFHPQEYKVKHQYRLDVYNETGVVFSQEFDGSQPAYFAIDAEDCQYYRAEVYDMTNRYIFALGNPIWNLSN